MLYHETRAILTARHNIAGVIKISCSEGTNSVYVRFLLSTSFFFFIRDTVGVESCLRKGGRRRCLLHF